jgi:ribosomal protein L11 methyltransferase
MQKWYEVVLTTDKDFLPELTVMLACLHIESWVEEEEKDKVHLKIYIPSYEDIKGTEEYIQEFTERLKSGRIQIEVREIEDQNWATSWQKFYEVVRIGNRTVVKPPWIDYEEKPDDIVIEIEPRMAFGSGYHPTTAGTLVLAEEYIKPGMSILDMGCGSGILAIASAYLGASSIVGADYDEICIRESEENYDKALKRSPRITKDVRFILSDGFREIDGQYDIVMVNVHTQFILDNIKNITDSIKPGGYFISGSVSPLNLDEVIEKLQTNGMHLLKTREQEGWMGVVFKKNV